ncbi:phytase L [Coprinopsis marcescibilis]|uniref:Phytase L n=1 Tax=Coprinopsis marcescibilis TaxID=230819 RepID=A0A5C3L782_COPMA|nr:phytase L [Coprinopsis marcescibilis]
MECPEPNTGAMLSLVCLATLLVPSWVATSVSGLLIPVDSYAPSESKAPIAIHYSSGSSSDNAFFTSNITGTFAQGFPGLSNVAATTYAGDAKAVTVLYGQNAQDDLLVNLIIEDSTVVATSLRRNGNRPPNRFQLRLWGDYSTLCAVGSSFVYIFGKGSVKLIVVEQDRFNEVADFAVPVEAEACAATASGTVFFGGNDGAIYSFSGNNIQPGATVQRMNGISVDGEIAGLAIYETPTEPYLLVSVQSGTIEVFRTTQIAHHLSITVSAEEAELEGIAIYQRPLPNYPSGALLVSFDEDSGPKPQRRKGVGIASLSQLGVPLYTSFNPRSSLRNPRPHDRCSKNGFRTSNSQCICFAGYSGNRCEQRSCPNNCSSHGSCASANTCRCNTGWSGADCSYKVINANIETDANGGDGDDPAIWIHPTDRTKSRVLTTTKSEDGAGFALFDLTGHIVAQLPAGEPNNVDVIYNFPLADGRAVDLAVAACRDEDTICILEVTENGLSNLINLPTKDDFTVYGSCVYHSRISDKFYIFVNSKTAEYLQFELKPTLEVELVREFIGGNGGQVEGCVVDDENAVIFVGEEPYGLWKYSAEPDSGNDRILVDSIEGRLEPDVEGVTLIYGKTNNTGLILVSCQGVSAYNIYRRAGNHEYLGTFTISAGTVDRVTNTDGVTAVGTNLGLPGFENGLAVVHDDVNTAQDGTRQSGASFKLVGLGEILGAFSLLDEVDTDWDPRAR